MNREEVARRITKGERWPDGEDGNLNQCLIYTHAPAHKTPSPMCHLTSAMSGARQRPRWHSVRLDRVVRRDSDAREQLLPWLLRFTSGRRDFRGVSPGLRAS